MGRENTSAGENAHAAPETNEILASAETKVAQSTNAPKQETNEVGGTENVLRRYAINCAN